MSNPNFAKRPLNSNQQARDGHRLAQNCSEKRRVLVQIAGVGRCACVQQLRDYRRPMAVGRVMKRRREAIVHRRHQRRISVQQQLHLSRGTLNKQSKGQGFLFRPARRCPTARRDACWTHPKLCRWRVRRSAAASEGLPHPGEPPSTFLENPICEKQKKKRASHSFYMNEDQPLLSF